MTNIEFSFPHAMDLRCRAVFTAGRHVECGKRFVLSGIHTRWEQLTLTSSLVIVEVFSFRLIVLRMHPVLYASLFFFRVLL